MSIAGDSDHVHIPKRRNPYWVRLENEINTHPKEALKILLEEHRDLLLEVLHKEVKPSGYRCFNCGPMEEKGDMICHYCHRDVIKEV